MKKYTVKNIFNEMLNVEVQHKLFEQTIDGVFFWKIIRFDLFIELTQRLNLYENPHPGLIPQNGNKLFLYMKKTLAGTLKNPLRDKKRFDTLIFPHPRKMLLEDNLVDIYSFYIELELQKKGVSFGVVEKPFAGKISRRQSDNVYWDIPFSIKTLISFFNSKRTIQDMDDCFINGIKEIAGINIDEVTTLKMENLVNVVRNYQFLFKYYTKVLKYHKPKEIILVVAYGQEPLVAAAQSLNIKVTELQHGSITPYHTGYSFPSGISIPYFPDEIRIWGEFWNDNSHLPITGERIVYTGFQYLEEEILKNREISRIKKRVLFISDAPTARELHSVMTNYAKYNRDYEVICRLHPSEVAVWQSLYPRLYEASKELNNLSIEVPSEIPLYESLLLSTYVVGVSSTVIIESLVAGCQLILLNLPGIEHFQALIDKKICPVVSNHKELKDVINMNVYNKIDKKYFFSDVKKFR